MTVCRNRLLVLGNAVCVIAIAFIMTAGPGIGTAQDSLALATLAHPLLLAGPHPHHPSVAPSLLVQAEASLAAGAGPAGGNSMACTNAVSGLTCSAAAPATNPSISAPAAFLPTRPENATPSARYGAALAEYIAYGTADPTDVVLFGGANLSGYVFNDTWIFTEGNDTWANITSFLHCTVTSCPSARHDAAAAFLPNAASNRTYLFGGCTVVSPNWTESVLPCDTSSSHILNDTWAFSDPSPGWGKWNWSRLSTPTAPSRRYGAAVTISPSNNSLILFGGCGAGSACPLNDTWKFNGTSWTNLTLNGPSPRYGAAFGFTKTLGGSDEDALFGGCGTSRAGCVSGSVSKALQDTWILSTALTWTELYSAANCATVTCPTPRYFTAYGSVTSPQSVLELYGGVGPGGVVLGDSVEGAGWWAFQGTTGTWGSDTTPTDTAGVTGLKAWSGPSPVGPPLDRYDGMFVYADNFGNLLFGGSAESGSSLGDTWVARQFPAPTFSGLIWPPPGPSPTYGASMVEDYADGYDLEFGGCGAECGNVSTWTYSSTFSDTAGVPTPWESLAPGLSAANSPPARMNASMVYFNDAPSVVEVVLFGGLSSNGTLLNDTWAFAAGTWTLQHVANDQAPSPRQAAAFAYNSTNSDAVLFGGCGSTCPLGDTWLLKWTGAKLSWTHASPTSSPSARYGSVLGYDAVDGLMVLFGGCGSTCPLGDTWTFKDGASPTWTQCTAGTCASGSAPSARWGAALTYDQGNHELVMFGGCGATCPLGDTWVFNMTNLLRPRWSQPMMGQTATARYDAVLADQPPGDDPVLDGGIGAAGRLLGGPGYYFVAPSHGGLDWSWVTASSLNEIPRAPAPVPRYGASLAYDSVDDYVLLVGGCQFTKVTTNCGAMASASTTWLFKNGSWVLGCAECGPSARWDSALTFDTASSEFVLFGGCEASDNSCLTGTVLGDTWTYSSGSWTQLTPSPSPEARGDASVAYDSVDKVVVLFGGLGCTSLCPDTWTFSSGTWTKWSGSNPSARLGAASAWNGVSNEVLLFGGMLSTGLPSAQTWVFTMGSGWLQLPITRPTAVYDASMITLPNGTDLLLGGAVAAGAPSSATRLFLAGNWTASAGSLPAQISRWGMAAVFDPAVGPNGYGLIFGGSLGGDLYGAVMLTGSCQGQGDTWQLLVNPQPSTPTVYYDVSLDP